METLPPEQAKSKTKDKIFIAIGALIFAAAVFYYGFGFAATYFLNQGMKQIQSGSFESAKTQINRSLVFDSKRPESYYYLALAARGRQDAEKGYVFPDAEYGEAINHYEKSITFGIKKEPVLHARALNNLGYFNHILKNYKTSDEYYLTLIDTYPLAAFNARFFVALDYVDRFNKPAEALEILIPAKNIAFGVNVAYTYRVHAMLARLYFYFEDYDKAIEEATAAIEFPEKKFSDDVYARNAYLVRGVAHAAEGDIKNALKDIEKASELAKTTNYGCLRAKAYYRAKDYSMAVKTAKDNTANSSGYLKSWCLSVLADSYAKLGDAKSAEAYKKEFIAFTDAFVEKNIFTMRDRERFMDVKK